MKRPEGSPPFILRFLLRAMAPPAIRDAVDGDLTERYRRALVQGKDSQRLGWWYRREVARSAWALVTSGVRPETTLSLMGAILFGTLLPLMPQVLLTALGPISRSSASYSILLALNILAAACLAPFGGAIAARLARTGSLIGPLAVALLLAAPPALAIWLAPEGEPLWARSAWILLVPAASLVGGSRYLDRKAMQ